MSCHKFKSYFGNGNMKSYLSPSRVILRFLITFGFRKGEGCVCALELLYVSSSAFYTSMLLNLAEPMYICELQQYVCELLVQRAIIKEQIGA